MGTQPTGIAVSLDGLLTYVTNLGPSNISVIDTTTNTVIETFATSPNPNWAACHPVRDESWIGVNGIGTVLEARSTVDHSLVATALGTIPYGSTGIVFRPDGNRAMGSESCGLCGRFHLIDGNLSGTTIPILQTSILH